MALRDLPPAQLEERSSGPGTITFGTAIGIRVPPGWPTAGTIAQAPAFVSVGGAGVVYRIIQDAKDAATPWLVGSMPRCTLIAVPESYPVLRMLI